MKAKKYDVVIIGAGITGLLLQLKLVEMGCNFDTGNDGIDSFQGVHEIEDDFASDGNKVNFYQVMGGVNYQLKQCSFQVVLTIH